MYLTGTVLMLLGPFLPEWILVIYFIAFLAYIWRSLAVAGSTGMIMSGFRMFFLLFFWIIVTSLIITATIIVSGMSVR